MDKRRPSPVATGMFAALIGVAVGAATVFFSDPRNRKRVMKMAYDAGDEAAQKLDEFKLAANNANKTTKKKLAGNLKNLAKQLEN